MCKMLRNLFYTRNPLLFHRNDGTSINIDKDKSKNIKKEYEEAEFEPNSRRTYI